MVVGAYVRTIQGVKDRLLIENGSLRAENERLTREEQALRQAWSNETREKNARIATLEEQVQARETESKGLYQSVATLEQQAREMEAAALLVTGRFGEGWRTGSLFRNTDAWAASMKEDIQRLQDAATAATNEGGNSTQSQPPTNEPTE